MTLVNRLGEDAAVDNLTRLLGGEVPLQQLVWAPYRNVLVDIGDGHAEGLMSDESGRRLDYWPRVWAARALSYVGSTDAGRALVAALGDDHWRVRMMATQAIGRLGIEDATHALIGCLGDDHPRVRSAAVLPLQRVGTLEAVDGLLQQRESETESHRIRVEQAVAKIIDRSEDQT